MALGVGSGGDSCRPMHDLGRITIHPGHSARRRPGGSQTMIFFGHQAGHLRATGWNRTHEDLLLPAMRQGSMYRLLAAAIYVSHGNCMVIVGGNSQQVSPVLTSLRVGDESTSMHGRLFGTRSHSHSRTAVQASTLHAQHFLSSCCRAPACSAPSQPAVDISTLNSGGTLQPAFSLWSDQLRILGTDLSNSRRLKDRDFKRCCTRAPDHPDLLDQANNLAQTRLLD